MTRRGEHGAALVTVLLMLALLLAMAMGTSLTAISELGVSNTYGTQTVALERCGSRAKSCGKPYDELGARPSQSYWRFAEPSSFSNLVGKLHGGADMITGNSSSTSPILPARVRANTKWLPPSQMATSARLDRRSSSRRKLQCSPARRRA